MAINAFSGFVAGPPVVGYISLGMRLAFALVA